MLLDVLRHGSSGGALSAPTKLLARPRLGEETVRTLGLNLAGRDFWLVMEVSEDFLLRGLLPSEVVVLDVYGRALNFSRGVSRKDPALLIDITGTDSAGSASISELRTCLSREPDDELEPTGRASSESDIVPRGDSRELEKIEI